MKTQEHQNIVYLLKLLIIIFITVAAMAVIFTTGVWVGQQRAQFSFAWAENYHKNFGGPKQGLFGDLPMADYTDSHGVYGMVLGITNNVMVVQGDDATEKMVVVTEATSLVKGKTAITLEAIKPGDSVVVIGQPNAQAQIEATFIRVLPLHEPR